MAIPNAPLEGAGDKMMFVVWDNTGTNAAAILRAYRKATLNATDVAEMGVYPTSGALWNGCQTLATGSPEALSATSIPCQGVLVKATKENAATIFVGRTGSTADYADTTGAYPLEPGESVGVPCRNVNEVYIRGTASDRVAWLASID